MKVTIVNLQKKISLDSTAYREYSSRLCETVSEAAAKELSVAFISDRRMKELNKFFRGKDSTTDVLSFPHEPDEFENNAPPAAADSTEFLGDIVISVEQAARQAEENGLTLDGEIRQLILHGLLHLCGYDHETDNGEMNARELELRELLNV
jgi:probable rRNA maturation factor